MSSLGAIAINTARTDAKRESRMDKQSIPTGRIATQLILLAGMIGCGSIGIRIAIIAFAKS
jgi:hypothetical protein